MILVSLVLVLLSNTNYFASPFKFTKTYNISNYNSLAFGGATTTDTVYATVVDTQNNSVTFQNPILLAFQRQTTHLQQLKPV